MKVINFENAKKIPIRSTSRYKEVATMRPDKVLDNWAKVADNRSYEEVMLIPVYAHNALIKLLRNVTKQS